MNPSDTAARANKPTRTYAYTQTKQDADGHHLLRIDGKEIILSDAQFHDLVLRGHIAKPNEHAK